MPVIHNLSFHFTDTYYIFMQNLIDTFNTLSINKCRWGSQSIEWELNATSNYVIRKGTTISSLFSTLMSFTACAASFTKFLIFNRKIMRQFEIKLLCLSHHKNFFVCLIWCQQIFRVWNVFEKALNRVYSINLIYKKSVVTYHCILIRWFECYSIDERVAVRKAWHGHCTHSVLGDESPRLRRLWCS